MSDNSNMASREVRTFFRSLQRPFPDPADGKILTAEFLEASKSVVVLVEQFGKVFAPVRYDMNGNIQKLSSKYNESPQKFEYLNNMILCEQAEGNNLVTDGLLWLRRALHFVHSFFLSIYEDTKSNQQTEDLSKNVNKAYSETLEMYHGWMAQQLFKLLSKMVPSRTQLLIALALNEEVEEDILFQDMGNFLTNLNSNIVFLIDFYAENNLDSALKCK